MLDEARAQELWPKHLLQSLAEDGSILEIRKGCSLPPVVERVEPSQKRRLLGSGELRHRDTGVGTRRAEVIKVNSRDSVVQ